MQNFTNPKGSNKIPGKYLSTSTTSVNVKNQWIPNSNIFRQNTDVSNPVNVQKPSILPENKENIIKQQIKSQNQISKPFDNSNIENINHIIINKQHQVSNNIKKGPIKIVNRNQGGNSKNLETDNYMLIKQLVPFQYLRIKARISKKSEIYNYTKNDQEGKVFSIDLLDEEGSEIQGSFFRDAVDKWFPLLQERKLYMISEGQVKIQNQRRSV